MELECPCCGQMVKPNNVVYFNSDNEECVIVRTVENGFDDTGYDRFERAVGRLLDAGGEHHHFRVAADYDMECRDIISCTEFEEYVDAMLSGKEWSWSETRTN